MIILDENAIAIWFVQLSPISDMTGAASRTPEGYKFIYRFRYYADEKTFNSEDIKHWYETRAPKEETEENFIDKVRFTVNALYAIAQISYPRAFKDEILTKGKTPDQIIEEFKSKPWAHSSKVT